MARYWTRIGMGIGIAALAASIAFAQTGAGIPLPSLPQGAVQAGDDPDGMLRNGKPAGKGWKSLFNGKSLDGWIGEKGYWKVQDGSIVGDKGKSTPHHHYMFSTKDYSDFAMHIDFRMTGYNSGVCCRIHPVTFDDVPGYQVDMGDGYWGCLWDEHHRQKKILDFPADEADKILHRGDWNHYYFRMIGHHYAIFLNGVKTGEGDDPEGYLSGPLGFQLCHGDNTVASFRNIYIKLFKPAEPGTAPKPEEPSTP